MGLGLIQMNLENCKNDLDQKSAVRLGEISLKYLPQLSPLVGILVREKCSKNPYFIESFRHFGVELRIEYTNIIPIR